MSQLKEQFTTRLGLIVSVLGIAIGTGNIWRFPRIAAQNAGEGGAGAFLFVWFIFLLIWSIPLIIAEYAIGKSSRKGLTGSFVLQLGSKFGWMGSFIGCVAIAIMFYYSVVTGWCFYYLGYFIANPLPVEVSETKAIWDGFQSSVWPIVGHFFAIFGCAFVVSKGIKSIEKVNKVLIPMLLLILIGSAIRAFTLDGSENGLAFLFTPDWSTLANPKIWLEALTQNAWDTGAGWGLILTYSIYMRSSDKIKISAFQTGFGNNAISMLSAMIIFSSVFAILGQSLSQSEVLAIMKDSGPASTGLTFIWLPKLFSYMAGGRFFGILFFAGLSFAAFSSLISMVEMAARMGVDLGLSRAKAAWIIAIIAFFAGIPSAVNLNFLGNQDFVWGVALMISGGFIAFAVIKQNAAVFKKSAIVTKESGDKLGKWWDLLITYIIPLEAGILLLWWMYRSAFEFSPDTWYNPLDPYSLASTILQWALLIGLLILFNNKVSKRFSSKL